MSNAMSEQRISDERLACLLRHFESPHGLKMQSDTDTAAALRELAALRRPVVQTDEVETIRALLAKHYYPSEPGKAYRTLLSTLDAAQREIHEKNNQLHDLECSIDELRQVNQQQRGALQILANQGETLRCIHCSGKGTSEPVWMCDVEEWSEARPCSTCGGTGQLLTATQYLKTVPADWNKDSSLETWLPLTAEDLKRQAERIAELQRVPEERRDISERQAERKRHAAEGWTSFTQYMSDIDLLLSDNIRLRNAYADRVQTLGFVQDELTARNKECVELREQAELHQARKDLVTQQAQSIVEQRVRIERLEEALVSLCDCANAVADEHGSLLCFDSMHRRIADARAALAAADGQKQSADRTPEQYAIEHGRYLATAARHFMDACNAVFTAEQELDNSEPDTQAEVDDLISKVESAQEIRGERWRALERDIYEFTKRADRAYPLNKSGTGDGVAGD